MIKRLKNIISAVTVRIWLIIHSFLAVWRAADIDGNKKLFWLLALSNILIIIEGIYRIIKRCGRESKWFTPCIFFYLAGMVPAFWILELDKSERYTNIIESSNVTSVALSTINGVTLPIKLDADLWVEILEQSMLFVIIVARWLLPRGRLSRDQLSNLLFAYIGAGSDIMELFIVFEEADIRSDLQFSFGILGVWTLSLFQFVLNLTATIELGETPEGEDEEEGEEEKEEEEEEEDRMSICFDTVFGNEIWSVLIAISLQDGPFLGVRLYAIFIKGVISYGILFFTAKNVLVIFLLAYRVIVLLFDPDDNEPAQYQGTKASKEELDLNENCKY